MIRRIAGFLMASGLAQVVGILAGIAQARTLGPAGKSVVAYAAVGLGLVLTATDGLTASILTQAGRDGLRPAVVLAALRRLVLALGIPIALVGAAIGLAVPSQRPLIGAAFIVPFAIFMQGARGALLANGRARDVIVLDTVNGTAYGLLLIPLLVFAHIGPYAALALWALAWTVTAAIAARAARRIEPHALRPAPAEVRRAFGEQLRRGARNSVTMLAGFFNLRIDVFVVSAVLGARELGLYTLAVMSGELLWSVSQPIVWANLDRVARLPDDEAVELVVRLTRNVAVLQAVLAAVVAAIAPPLIGLVYGGRFAPSGLVLQLLLPGIALYAARALMGYYLLVRRERPFVLAAVQAGSAVCCALISLALFPRFGIAGAAIATSATYAAVVVVIAAWFCRSTGTRAAALVLPTADDLRWYRRTAATMLRRRAPGGAEGIVAAPR